MLINFRQGIISYSTLPKCLILKDGKVSLNVPKSVLLAFAHGITDYLYIENKNINNAWIGPFNNTDNYYLYWDIDLITGLRSFNHTKIAPSFDETFPVSPVIDQHFFNTSVNKMFFWNGNDWIEVVRVFAGKIIAGKLEINSLGSQVNIHVATSVDEIVFDFNNSPVKKFVTSTSFVFLTKDDKIESLLNNLVSINLETLDLRATTFDFIPKYYCVAFDGKNHLGDPVIKKTSFFDLDNEAVAITSENMDFGEVKQIITRGYIQDNSWEWNMPPLTSLFLGGDGEISLYVKNPFSVQRIGYIVNSTTIFVNIDKKIRFVK